MFFYYCTYPSIYYFICKKKTEENIPPSVRKYPLILLVTYEVKIPLISESASFFRQGQRIQNLFLLVTRPLPFLRVAASLPPGISDISYSST